MNGKIIYLLFLLVATVIAITNAVPYDSDKLYASDGLYAPDDSRPSHHLVVGRRTNYDQLAVKQNVVKSSSILQIVKIKQTFFTLNDRQKITQVNAFDQKTNGKGAYASLLAGGPGFNNVTLQFKSQRGHGINFVVEVYAE